MLYLGSKLSIILLFIDSKRSRIRTMIRHLAMYILIVSHILLAGILSSCSNDKILFLKINNADGIEAKSPVLLNGIKIGEIDKVNLNEDGIIIVQLGIDKDINLPSDSHFRIKRPSLLGTSTLVAYPGKSSTDILEGDTVAISEADTIDGEEYTSIIDFIQNLAGTSKQDSILIELRRLNKNLEEAKKNTR